MMLIALGQIVQDGLRQQPFSPKSHQTFRVEILRM